MLAIPGWLIGLLTFPGIILHEISHELFCRLTKTKVHEVIYYRFSTNKDEPAGYVLHDKPKNFTQSFFITLGPLIVNTIIAFLVAVIYIQYRTIPVLNLISLWLVFCFGMHAIPSLPDCRQLISESSNALKKFNLFGIIGVLFGGVMFVVSFLRIFWTDALYALGIASLAELLVNSNVLHFPNYIITILTVFTAYVILFPVIHKKRIKKELSDTHKNKILLFMMKNKTN